jgi:hypothetical protein
MVIAVFDFFVDLLETSYRQARDNSQGVMNKILAPHFSNSLVYTRLFLFLKKTLFHLRLPWRPLIDIYIFHLSWLVCTTKECMGHLELRSTLLESFF